MKDIKGKIKLLIFSSISFILPLILMEFLMVVLEPFVPTGMYQYDADMGFRVRPNYDTWGIRTNKFGFNDRDYDVQKEPGNYRVLMLGDSFNWAGGKPNNYVTLIRRKFNEHYGKHRVDIINAGYPGTSTPQQLELLKKYAIQYNPDMVVLGFFVGNDYLEGDPHRKQIVVNDTFIYVDRDKEVNFLGYPVVSQSRLLTFIQQKYKALTEIDNLRDPNGTLKEDAYLRVEFDRMDVANLNTVKQGKYKDNFEYVLRSVSEMSELLRSKNIKFAVTIIPDEYQVNDDLRNRVLAKFNAKAEDYDFLLPQKLLKERLDSLKIPYTDLLDGFRAKVKTQTLYKPRDTHWNNDGNKLAADIMFDILLKQIDPQLPK